MSGAAKAPGIGAIEGAVARGRGGPDTWNPPFCGDLDMRIAADGTWFYLGSPIGRKPLVKLFSSVLRREEDGRYVLVTPVEKCGLRVDDAPFVAIEMVAGESNGQQVLRFRTNVDDWVEAGPAHPIRFAHAADGAAKPYVHVRGRLEALVARAVFYDLVALGEERLIGSQRMFGVSSHGTFFAMEALGTADSTP